MLTHNLPYYIVQKIPKPFQYYEAYIQPDFVTECNIDINNLPFYNGNLEKDAPRYPLMQSNIMDRSIIIRVKQGYQIGAIAISCTAFTEDYYYVQMSSHVDDMLRSNGRNYKFTHKIFRSKIRIILRLCFIKELLMRTYPYLNFF